ncbi:NAD-binding protein [Halogeometricum sp. S1BR25-6]|uniref:NAD-binding protein n=1 Tax=Halogeometricum salsisoli TaxID=2950536 RepID=A0ABU2GFG8_9EURY|nr:NAD-binding protein [Halogeometricum sp. S1BR25-6]MDS0299519.1 NAD-binding protein [Halogeometricum sp. S1BR25-6]
MRLEREWVGARASMVLTLFVGVLSVVTGIANIGVSADVADFVLFGVTFPGYVQQVAAFTGTLTGFVLLVAAFGLRRRLRAAWYATMLLFPITAAQGALQSTQLSFPLIGLSAVAFVVVGLNFGAYDRELELTTTQLAALSALAGAQAYGTVGAYALREEFGDVETLLDAFYFSLVTGSTVGYGDITPATAVGKLFTLSVMLVTVSSFAAVLGVVFTPLIEARLSKALGRMTEEQLDLLENHVLVLGYGDLTEPILEELTAKADVLILTEDEERTRRLTERGYTVLTADPSDEESQHRGRVESARAVVVATNNDAEDALGILTARQLNPDVTIVAAASQRENVNKLKRAGADTVISPATLGAHFLAESALGGEGVEELERRLMSGDPSQADEAMQEALGGDDGDGDDDGTDGDGGDEREENGRRKGEN